MLQPGTYRGTHANLTYTLTLRPTQDGQHEMLLTLPGRPPHVWGTLTPKNVATWDEADLRMLLHAELDAAADMLADGLAGWPVELPDALDMDMVPQWVFGQLNAARVDFATGWIPCPCGRVQSRFRRQSGTYTVQARSRPLDWDAIAHDVLTLVSRGPFSRAGNDALDDSDPVAALLARVRADPALHTLALEASSFELPARTLEEVFVQLNNEHSELHDHVHHGEDALRLMMLRHAGPVLGIDVPAPLLAALDDSSPEAEFLRSLPPDALAQEFANLLLGHDDAWDDWNGDHMRMSVFLDTLHGPQSEPLPTLRRAAAPLASAIQHGTPLFETLWTYVLTVGHQLRKDLAGTAPPPLPDRAYSTLLAVLDDLEIPQDGELTWDTLLPDDEVVVEQPLLALLRALHQPPLPAGPQRTRQLTVALILSFQALYLSDADRLHESICAQVTARLVLP